MNTINTTTTTTTGIGHEASPSLTESLFSAFVQLSYYARVHCSVSHETWYEQLLLVLLIFPAYMPTYWLVVSWAASIAETVYVRMMVVPPPPPNENEAAENENSKADSSSSRGCCSWWRWNPGHWFNALVHFFICSETRCLSTGSSVTACVVGLLHPVYAASAAVPGCGDEGTASPSAETAIASFATTYIMLRLVARGVPSSLNLQLIMAAVPCTVALARVYIGFCTPPAAAAGSALGVVIAVAWHENVCPHNHH